MVKLGGCSGEDCRLKKTSRSLIVSLGATRFVTVALTVSEVNRNSRYFRIAKFYETPYALLSGLSSPPLEGRGHYPVFIAVDNYIL